MQDNYGWNRRCKECGMVIYGTHHVDEDFNSECMSHFSNRIIKGV